MDVIIYKVCWSDKVLGCIGRQIGMEGWMDV